jgi:hypothetical protein
VYAPDSFVVTLTVMLVPMFFTATLAPGTTAPLGSVTVPEIVPRYSWPETLIAKIAKINAADTAKKGRRWLFIFYTVL